MFLNEGFLLTESLFAAFKSRASAVTKNAKRFLNGILTTNQSLGVTFNVRARI